MRWWWSIPALTGCGSSLRGDGAPPDCEDATYPEGAVEPMALGKVLSPYSWPVAVDRRTGERIPLDLAAAPCDLDRDLDWSPFEALLFVSIPAW